MSARFRGTYPSDWKQIATRVKDEAGWACVRCGHEHDPATGYCLTIHHADGDKANQAWYNLLPLCQRCHLHIQGKVRMEQVWPFEHSAWFRPYVAGYYAARFGFDYDRATCEANADDLVAMGQGRGAP